MSIRSDSVSGIITCVFGILMAGFAAFGLMIVAFQAAILTMMPRADDSQEAAIFNSMHAMHRIFIIYIPMVLAGGLVFAISGYFVARGSLLARRMAQIVAICGYVWIVAYDISCYAILDDFPTPFNTMPEGVRQTLAWASIGMTTVFTAFFPTFLLFILSRRGDHADKLPA